jgi:hypothetical protein
MACRLHPPPPACRRRAPDPVSLRESLEGLLTDPRKPRGKRHPLPSLVSVMVAGVASGHGGAQAVAQAASWDQDVLAGHGCRISPRTGLRVPPPASMPDRLPGLLDADEFERRRPRAWRRPRSIPRSRPRTPRTGRMSSAGKRKGGRRGRGSRACPGRTVVSGLAGLRSARRGAARPVVGPAVSVHRQRRRASRCLTRRG